MKEIKKLFYMACTVLGLVATGCTDPIDEGSKYGDIAVFFGSDNLTVEAGGVISVPFTVLGSEGVVLNLNAKCDDSEVALNLKYDATYSGTIEFTAPKVVVNEKKVTVTLEVNDKHGRNASGSTMVNIEKSEALTVSLAEDIKSMAVQANGSFSLPFVITGKGDADITDSNVTLNVTSGWTATCSWNENKDGGLFMITAPASLTESLKIEFTVTDSYNRTAELEKDLAIVGISIAENAANCHIAAPGSTLTIKAVKGNSTEELDFTSASLVWQDKLGMVKSVSGNNAAKVIVVELNGGISGNAVVAAKKDGVIVWSWHVWVTDFNPEDDPFVWTSKSTGTTYTYMDRNLGALSAEKYTQEALGLLYQWGRKDPFVGADGITSMKYIKKYDIDGNQVHEVSEQRPRLSDHTSTNLELSIQNPAVFYYSNEAGFADWLTHDSNRQNNDLWGGVSNIKSIYDPCPEGWMVPAGGDGWGFRKEFKKDGTAMDSGAYHSDYAWYIESAEGKNVGYRYKTESGKEYWFPFTGDKYPHDGTLKEVGEGGDIHTRTPDGSFAKIQVLAYGNPTSESGLNRTYGSSVRCIKEN